MLHTIVQGFEATEQIRHVHLGVLGDRINLPSLVSFTSSGQPGNRHQLLVLLRKPIRPIGNQQVLAGRQLSLDLGKVRRKADSLGASLLELIAAPTNHERHLTVSQYCFQSARTKLAPPLALGSISVYPERP
jgi:hypothetical protein